MVCTGIRVDSPGQLLYVILRIQFARPALQDAASCIG